MKVFRDGDYPVMRRTFFELMGRGSSTPTAAFPTTGHTPARMIETALDLLACNNVLAAAGLNLSWFAMEHRVTE